MTMTFTRKISWIPGYDKRSSVPGENYGQHPPHIAFIVSNAFGSVVLSINTGRYPDEKENARPQLFGHSADVSFHSKRKLYVEHDESKCGYVEGGGCYCWNIYALGLDLAQKALTLKEDEIFLLLEKLHEDNITQDCYEI